MARFTNRVVMITGASGNLGTALTRPFLTEGAKVVLVDRKKELLLESFPELVDRPDCYMSGDADLTSAEDVNQIVTAAIDHFGRIDVLANTVGGYRAGAPIQETSLDTWDFMLNLNARSVFNMTQYLVPHMLKQGSGKIIHTAARPGLQGAAGASAYSVSKSAVIRLVESTSAEVKRHGINVNCIVPGTIDTPSNREAMPDADFSQWVAPESLADVILFLASDASRDIHGAAIPVYGLT